jgi:hypothetical protein
MDDRGCIQSSSASVVEVAHRGSLGKGHQCARWCVTSLGYDIRLEVVVGEGATVLDLEDQNAKVTVTVSLAEEALAVFPTKSSMAKRLQIGLSKTCMTGLHRPASSTDLLT